VVAPVIVGALAVQGEPVEGHVLRAVFEGSVGGTASDRSFIWHRCGSPQGPCQEIPGATADTYRTGPADVGAWLAVVMRHDNEAGAATVYSDRTAFIAAAPAPVVPPKQPTPTTKQPTPATEPSKATLRSARCRRRRCRLVLRLTGNDEMLAALTAFLAPYRDGRAPADHGRT
jgi:hypothetical protein